MALISIQNSSGTYIDLVPTPSALSVGIMDISKADRNANGLMIIERITSKRKLDISYEFLTAANLKTILALVQQTFFNVKYVDPLDNAIRTGSFYAGDRQVSMVDYINSIPRYKGVSFSLIER